MIPAGLAAAGAATGASRLPAAPPRPAGLWDHGNRHKTLLAIGAGLLSGGNFGEGMARAGQNVLGLEESLRTSSKAGREFGGPDDAFEIITDPVTGERSVQPVPAFQEYLEAKRVKQKDVADINGRAMFALQQLPEDQRPAAYEQMRQNPEHFGVDPTKMPEAYDPNYAAVTSGMGMTVSQALTRQQAKDNAAALQDYRQDVQADRTARTGIYRDRSIATTAQGAQRIAQGDARIAQGAQRLAISKTKGSGGGSSRGGLDNRYEYRIGPNGQVQKRLKK
ncbi:hypothetical protein [Sphingomonas desiccabilis]|nr:hypothetical protein [Sphingomonas desiccabilis]